MNNHKEHIINLHWFLVIILIVGFLECVLQWSSFLFVNSHGYNHQGLVLAQILVQICRDTFARVVMLLVSLGYGILIQTINRYFNKIFIITILYMAALSFLLAVEHINYYSPVSGSFKLLALIPESTIDFIFCFWICLALRRTLNYLKVKEQRYKYKIIS